MPAFVRKLLRKFAHPAIPRTYLLGSTSSFVNINAQQQRAFNLVYSLFEERILEPGMEVAVVGGGIAGLSASSALLVRDVRVTIFERTQEVLGLQRGNLTRFVHPQIARWPDTGSGYPLTELPYLNWQGGIAGTVVSDLLEQWNILRREYEPLLLSVLTNCKVVQLLAEQDHVRLRTTSGFESEFDFVVFAGGYGLENDLDRTPSYWRNDDFAQPVLDRRLSIRKYFISGAGDGGLTEILRLKILDFNHQAFLQNVIFQNSLMSAGRLAKAGNWDAAWNAGNVQEIREQFAPFFANNRMRTDTDVVFGGQKKWNWYVDNGAQILHTVCVKLLHDTQSISYRRSSGLSRFLMRLFGHKLVIRHGATSPILKIYPTLSGQELRNARTIAALTDEEIPKPYRRAYPKYWLADEFMKAHFEAAYEVGFAMTSNIGDLLEKARRILFLLRCEATEDELNTLDEAPIECVFAFFWPANRISNWPVNRMFLAC